MDVQKAIEAEIPRLKRYARSLVRNSGSADDLVQDCLTRALSKIYLWQEGTDLRAWLFTILHNQHVNYVRLAVRTGNTIELPGFDQSLTILPTQDKHLELRDLDKALAQLPEAQRAVVLLVGLEGMSYEAVGEKLGIPVGTVRSRLSRGRERLRLLMNGEDRPRGMESLSIDQ